MRGLQIGEISSRILINRGIEDLEDAKIFMNTRLRDVMPDPLFFLDMGNAIERVSNSILKNERIFVYGDYDVDGVSSTFLLLNYFKLIGFSNFEYHLPNRFVDGYGLSLKSIDRALENKSDLMIVVDSGITSVREIDYANEKNLDIIIFDHHMPHGSDIPRAFAIVNPNRIDQENFENSFIKNLCAAGIVFIFLVGLQRELKNRGFFENSNKNIPDLTNFLDIVSLGTLCDVMDIVGINRAYINFFMKKQTYSIGIRALMIILGMERINNAEDLSFYIGPIINASGRIHDPKIALNLFLSENLEDALPIAEKLVHTNLKRRDMEKNLLDDVIKMIEEKKLYEKPYIFAYGENWHEGIIGIIAGRIKDKYNKPSFIASFDENNKKGKGSARSIPEIPLNILFNEVREKKILQKCGGHALAGGFSLDFEDIEKFDNFLSNYIQNKEYIHNINIDYILPTNVDLEYVCREISVIEPYGKKVERPFFCFEKVRIISMKKTNDLKHMMISIHGSISGIVRLIIFNIHSKNDLIHNIEKYKDCILDIIVSITYNEKYGVSVVLEDARLHEGDVL